MPSAARATTLRNLSARAVVGASMRDGFLLDRQSGPLSISAAKSG
jgi:hypothetical protein